MYVIFRSFPHRAHVRDRIGRCPMEIDNLNSIGSRFGICWQTGRQSMPRDKHKLYSADMIVVQRASSDGSQGGPRDGGRRCCFEHIIQDSFDNKEVKSGTERDAMGLRGDGRVAAGLTTDGLLRLCAAALLFFGITIAGPSASATSAKQPAAVCPRSPRRMLCIFSAARKRRAPILSICGEW